MTDTKALTELLAQLERVAYEMHCEDKTDWCARVHDAAAAIRELRTAALARLHYGHSDTCSMMLIDSKTYDCSCGHDALSDAVHGPGDAARSQRGEESRD